MTTSSSQALEYRHLWIDDLETRIEGGDDGSFKGYACRWGIRDSHGTEFERRSFGTADSGGPLPLLWMHNPSDPVGTFSWRQDDEGLWIEGKYDDTPEGHRARVRAKSSAPGLSVGFLRKKNNKNDSTRISEAELREVSQITLGFASQPGAELVALRRAAEIAEQLDDSEQLSTRQIVELTIETLRSEQRADFPPATPEVPEELEDPEPEDEEVDEPQPPAKGSYEDKTIQVAAAITEWAEANHEGKTVHVKGTFDDHVLVDVDGEESKLTYTVAEDGSVELTEGESPELEEERSDPNDPEPDPEKPGLPTPDEKVNDQDPEQPKPVDAVEGDEEQRKERERELARLLLTGGPSYPKAG